MERESDENKSICRREFGGVRKSRMKQKDTPKRVWWARENRTKTKKNKESLGGKKRVWVKKSQINISVGDELRGRFMASIK
jgi:hypothetical protein